MSGHVRINRRAPSETREGPGIPQHNTIPQTLDNTSPRIVSFQFFPSQVSTARGGALLRSGVCRSPPPEQRASRRGRTAFPAGDRASTSAAPSPNPSTVTPRRRGSARLPSHPNQSRRPPAFRFSLSGCSAPLPPIADGKSRAHPNPIPENSNGRPPAPIDRRPRSTRSIRRPSTGRDDGRENGAHHGRRAVAAAACAAAARGKERDRIGRNHWKEYLVLVTRHIDRSGNNKPRVTQSDPAAKQGFGASARTRHVCGVVHARAQY